MIGCSNYSSIFFIQTLMNVWWLIPFVTSMLFARTQ